MSTQHTPGPWIAVGPDFGDQLPHHITEILSEPIEEGGDWITICQMPLDELDPTQEANASLITAIAIAKATGDAA